MATITISLDDRLMQELVQMARDEGTTEAELAGKWIERLLRSRLAGLETPPLARRLGPLAFPADDRAHNELANEAWGKDAGGRPRDGAQDEHGDKQGHP
jgi:hypothetical protein